MSKTPEKRHKTGFRGPSPDVGKATQFPPGVSGNPGGRPKSRWLSEVTAEMLAEKLGDPAFRAQFKEALWKRLLSDKVSGSMTLDRLWERTEGKLPEEIGLSENVNSCITIQFVKAVNGKSVDDDEKG